MPYLDSDGNLVAEICFLQVKVSEDLASAPYAVILTELSSAVEYEYSEGYLLSMTLTTAVCF